MFLFSNSVSLSTFFTLLNKRSYLPLNRLAICESSLTPSTTFVQLNLFLRSTRAVFQQFLFSFQSIEFESDALVLLCFFFFNVRNI